VLLLGNRDVITGMRYRRDSSTSSAFGSSYLSATSSVCSERRDHGRVPNNMSSSMTASSPYEYDMVSAQSSESVDIRPPATVPTYYGGPCLANSISSDGDAGSSCRFSGRGGVSRFLAARRRQSSDSGLPTDSTDFRRVSEPILNDDSVAPDATSSPYQRCHSAGGAGVPPETFRRTNRMPASLCSSRPSLMSSRSSIVTNGSAVSDDPNEMKHIPDIVCSPASQPGSQSDSVFSPAPPSTIADSVVGDLIIPDEMRDFINATYSAAAADSTVADSPAALSPGALSPTAVPCNIRSSPAVEHDVRRSCMYGATQSKLASDQPSPARSDVACETSSVRSEQSSGAGSTGWLRPTHPPTPAVRSSDGGQQIQVSQVSQSLPAEPGQFPNVPPSVHQPSYSVTHQQRPVPSAFNAHQLTSYGATDDAAARYRRNPHQMNWWARNYGYYNHPHQPQMPGMYRLNADLTSGGRMIAHSSMPSAASAMQMSPNCNQVSVT